MNNICKCSVCGSETTCAILDESNQTIAELKRTKEELENLKEKSREYIASIRDSCEKCQASGRNSDC
jgi:hypothetical protein